jgi:hypothetical protein
MKTIIEMAREAGLHRQQHNLMSNPVQYRFSYDGYEENLERFAEIVRAEERNRTWTQQHWTEYERSIAAAEREACAKICEEEYDTGLLMAPESPSLAAKIRARSGEQK